MFSVLPSSASSSLEASDPNFSLAEALSQCLKKWQNPNPSPPVSLRSPETLYANSDGEIQLFPTGQSMASSYLIDSNLDGATQLFPNDQSMASSSSSSCWIYPKPNEETQFMTMDQSMVSSSSSCWIYPKPNGETQFMTMDQSMASSYYFTGSNSNQRTQLINNQSTTSFSSSYCIDLNPNGNAQHANYQSTASSSPSWLINPHLNGKTQLFSADKCLAAASSSYFINDPHPNGGMIITRPSSSSSSSSSYVPPADQRKNASSSYPSSSKTRQIQKGRSKRSSSRKCDSSAYKTVFVDQESFAATVKLHTAMEASSSVSSFSSSSFPVGNLLWDYPVPVDFTC